MGAAFAAAGTVAEIGAAMALAKDATVVNGEGIDRPRRPAHVRRRDP